MRPCVLTSSLLGLAMSMGCGGNTTRPSSVDSPHTPNALTSAAAPTGPSGELWHLTTTLAAVDGPDNCFSEGARSRLGASTAWTMAVDRSGNTVSFDYDVHNWPTDDVLETGTVTGVAFAAQSIVQRSFFPDCADGTVLNGTFQATVVGRFSGDGSHLDGNGEWVYSFSSGTITEHMTWSADR